MLRSFLVLCVCCVGFSVQEYADYMDYISAFYPECAQNEVLACIRPCPQKTCGSTDQTWTLEERIKCSNEYALCEIDCVCKEGYIRSVKGGQCILEKQCDKCPGADEHYACGGPCDNVCNTLHLQNQTSCPHTYTECHPSCYCNRRYARDINGVCIPIENCGKENMV